MGMVLKYTTGFGDCISVLTIVLLYFHHFRQPSKHNIGSHSQHWVSHWTVV